MYQVTQRGGMRASAAVAYLHPAAERPNLTVMPYMHVNRVLFEGTRAVGVEATQLGQAPGAARRARGDPLRRRLQLAAAADALRHRPGRAPGDARDRGAARPAGGGGEPQRPPRHLRRLDHARAREPAGGAGAGGDGGVRGLPDRPLRLQPGRVGRLRPGRQRRRGARRPVPRRPDPHRRRGDGGPAGTRRLGLALPAHAREPRLGAARLQRPDREADRPQRLLRGRGRPGADDRRRAPGAGDLRPALVPALLRRALHRARRRLRATPCAPTSPAPPSRSTTRSAPARSARSSTPSCASRGSRACASSTPR